MISLLDKTKISSYNFIFPFTIILYGGAATQFARSLGNLSSIGNTIALLLLFIFFYKNKIKINNTFLFYISGFTLYAILTFIQNNRISLMWLTQIYIFMTIAYSICYVLKSKFFVVYETILYKLCCLSLIIWGLYLLFPTPILELGNLIQFDKTFTDESESCNIIFYNFLFGRENDFEIITRNCGFAWEPGAFSSYIIFAIFCNILRTDFKIKDNKPLLIFFTSLITTQSTTGFGILVIILLFFIFYKKKFGYLTILLPLILVIINLPFVTDKLLEEYNNIQNVNINLFDSTSHHSLGRMYSLVLDYEEFLRHPLLGLGGYEDGRWLYQQGYTISTISGIGTLLYKYGIINTILFIVVLLQTCKLITKQFNRKTGYLLFPILIGIMISYEIWLQPIIICFWMYSIFTKENKQNNEIKLRSSNSYKRMLS